MLFLFRAAEVTRNALSINSSQIEIMTVFMEQHPDLARNLLKTADAKRNTHILWNNLTDALNMQGPPMREISEWKKVSFIYTYINLLIKIVGLFLGLG